MTSEQHAVPPEGGERLIEARDLCLRYAARQVLDHVDMDVTRGEIVTLVGLNGCGKSTLARVLLGLVAPDTGTVWRAPGLRVGYTPQDLAIDRTLPLTVARFLTLGQSAARDRLIAALREVGAEGVIDNQLWEISGGELHRVALARALLREPDLLVLDEPVAGVDVSRQADLYDLIARIRDRRGCGVLLISHDLNLVMAATDRVVCLNHHVCCTGRPLEVVRDPEGINKLQVFVEREVWNRRRYLWRPVVKHTDVDVLEIAVKGVTDRDPHWHDLP